MNELNKILETFSQDFFNEKGLTLFGVLAVIGFASCLLALDKNNIEKENK